MCNAEVSESVSERKKMDIYRMLNCYLNMIVTHERPKLELQDCMTVLSAQSVTVVWEKKKKVIQFKSEIYFSIRSSSRHVPQVVWLGHISHRLKIFLTVSYNASHKIESQSEEKRDEVRSEKEMQRQRGEEEEDTEGAAG